MATSRTQKKDVVARLTELLKTATSVVFAEQSAIGVADLDVLRAKARAQHITILLSKKTLTTIAAKQAGLDDVDITRLPNSVMTVIGYDDEVAPARLVAEFAKQHHTMQIVGGVFEGRFTSQERMVALSKLPSKTELYAKLVGSLNAPVSGFVRVLSGNMRGLVTVLKHIQEQKT